MAFDGGGGFKSTNRAPAMAHKRSMERKSMGAGMAERTDPLAQPAEGGEMDGEDGSQVAQEHGPATHIEVDHNHEMGEHKVMSHHPDGHMHESMHPSVEEAHEHAKKLAGAGSEHEMGGEGQEEAEYE